MAGDDRRPRAEDRPAASDLHRGPGSGLRTNRGALVARQSWKLTVRAGPRVTRKRFDELDGALRALQAQAEVLAEGAPRRAVDAKIRRFEPVQQVVGRLELAGPQRLSPSVRAGIDVRGDGSTEAFLGRVHRLVIEPSRHEDPYRALARAVRDRLD